ncbi:ATP-grasp domain-containing protein [Corynebacterium glucuronolyticum]|nr:ATP-grasp domain-containing protein [Corynebacterium glucuronolyticum]
MTERILIIGGSELQLPAILEARSMGLEVGVADQDVHAIGRSYADVFFPISTIDEQAVVETARSWCPSAIITIATDWPMRSVARACEALQLPSISYRTARLRTDKFLMIQEFQRCDVAAPWFRLIQAEEDIDSISIPSYPCVTKPVDSSGSRGVQVVENFEQLKNAIDYSSKQSRLGMVLVEEFLDGPEVSVEMLVIDGHAHVLVITDKVTSGPPNFVESAHFQPSQLEPEIKEKIEQLSKQAVEALEITTGAVHAEIIVTPRGPKMVEVGARMGGDRIGSHMVELSTGINMTRAVIQLAFGQKPDIELRTPRYVAHRFLRANPGQVVRIDGVIQAREIPGVQEVFINRSVGSRQPETRSSGDRPGSVLVAGENYEEVVEAAERAAGLIHFVVE